MLTFVKKLVSTFGVGFESVSSVYCAISSTTSESIARRAQATAQDPVFVKLKEQFVEDFDFGFVLPFFITFACKVIFDQANWFVAPSSKQTGMYCF